MSPNPFKPTAGKMPPILIGRDDIIGVFQQGLDNGAGAPERLMLVTGQRGSGKTVLLTEFGRVAAANGWDVVSETASAGLAQRLIETLAAGPHVSRATLEPSVSVGGASVTLGSIEVSRSQAPLTLRAAIEVRLGQLPPGKGILITIDEVQAAQREDLVAVATAVQHVIRDQDMTDAPDAEKRGVAVVFAGLVSVIDDLVNDEVLTFLRRYVRRNLGNVPLPDVRNAYLRSIEDAGKNMSLQDAQTAAELSDGFPYMIQLVGYYMWQAADARRSATIEREDVELGSKDAETTFEEAVCAPAMHSLTEAQRQFVLAMGEDWPLPSKVSDIAFRCGKSKSWASKYRSSLVRANIISPAGRGLVAYEVPHLGEYVCRHR